MTALQAPRPQRRSPRETNAAPRPLLRPVPPRSGQIATIPFAMVVALVMAAGMVCLLVLTTSLGSRAFIVQDKQSEAARLADQVAALQSDVAQARSVQSLAVSAQKLGMRPDPYGTQLVLPEKTVVGKEVAVSGTEIPSVRYLTPEQAKAQIEAMAKAEADRLAKQEATARKKAEAAARKKAEAVEKAKAEAVAERKAEAAAEEEAAAAKPEDEKKGRGE